MREREKNIFPNLIFSKIFWLICLCLFFVVLYGVAKGMIKNNQIDSEIADLETQIKQLDGQNQDFSQLINYLKSDEFIEQEAKLKFGYKKPGERLIVIPDEEIKLGGQVKETAKLSNLEKWWSYFFK